jgi:hypothetical protein
LNGLMIASIFFMRFPSPGSRAGTLGLGTVAMLAGPVPSQRQCG